MGEPEQVLPQNTHSHLVKKDVSLSNLSLSSYELQNKTNTAHQKQQLNQQYQFQYIRDFDIKDTQSKDIKNYEYQQNCNGLKELQNSNSNSIYGQQPALILQQQMQNSKKSHFSDVNNPELLNQNKIVLQQLQNEQELLQKKQINWKYYELKNDQKQFSQEELQKCYDELFSYKYFLSNSKLKDLYKKCVSIKQLSVQKQIVKVLCDTLSDQESLQSLANYEQQIWTQINKMARLLTYDSFKIQNAAQFFWNPLGIQRSIKTEIKNFQKLIRNFYNCSIFSFKKEWEALRTELVQLESNYTFNKQEDLKQFFQQVNNQQFLRLDLEDSRDVNDYGNTQNCTTNKSNDLFSKQKRLLEISLKIQHLGLFLNESKEHEDCDKNKNLRNGMYDYANTVYEILDKQTEDIQQACVLLANDKSNMIHFDSTALGVAMFYYMNLQPGPTGQYYYGLTNLPKITYISFKKSWDGLTEEVLNWNPSSHVSINPSIQTIVITESSFDYAPYNFTNYSNNQYQYCNTRPNTYKICLDQIEFEKYNKLKKSSKSNMIQSDDIVYIFENIIYPLIRVHKPSVIIMNHNFSYNNESSALIENRQNKNKDFFYSLKSHHFASIMQTLGTMCSQKILLISNNKFTDLKCDFEIFKKQQQNNAVSTPKNKNLSDYQLQQLPRKQNKKEKQLDNQIHHQINTENSYHKLNKTKQYQGFNQNSLISSESNYINFLDHSKANSKKQQKIQDKHIQKQIQIQNDNQNEFIVIDEEDESEKNGKNQEIKAQNKGQALPQQINMFDKYQMDTRNRQIPLENNKKIQKCLPHIQIEQQQQFMIMQNKFNCNDKQIKGESQSSLHLPNLNQFQDCNINNQVDFSQIIQQKQTYQTNQNYMQVLPSQLIYQINSIQPNYQIFPPQQEINKIQIDQVRQTEIQKKQNQESLNDTSVVNINNEEFLNLVSQFYLQILQKPIMNNHGKIVCFYIEKYFDLESQKEYLLKKIQNLEIKEDTSKDIIAVQENLMQIENNQQDLKKEADQIQNTHNQNLAQSVKEVSQNQNESKLKIYQQQLEVLQKKLNEIFKNIMEIFSQNNWILSNFVFNWQTVVKLIINEDDMEKYLLSQVEIDTNIQSKIEQLFKLETRVQKSQLKIVTIIFCLFKQQQKQTQNMMTNLISLKQSYSQREICRFDKKFTEYALQMLIQSIYSNAEIQDVCSNSYKSSINYLANSNTAFQLYIQEINKKFISERENHIKQYFLNENPSSELISSIVQDDEIRYQFFEQNSNFLYCFNGKQSKLYKMEEDKFINNPEPETSQMRQRKSEKINQDSVVSSVIVREEAINENKEMTSNQNKKSKTLQEQNATVLDEDKKKLNQFDQSKLLKTVKQVNQKISKSSLRCKLATEIKGLKHLTNLKSQSQNGVSTPLLNNLSAFKCNFNIPQNKQQETIPFTNNIRATSPIFYNQKSISTHNAMELDLQSQKAAVNSSSNNSKYILNGQSEKSTASTSANQYENLIKKDTKLIETINAKKNMMKKLQNEIFDIRQQKIVKLRTPQGLIFYDEDCQIQVIYLRQNTLEIYLFNVRIKNFYNHVILTQPFPDQEMFIPTYIPVQQQDLRFSSSLCYNQNFVFKIFGIQIMNRQTPTEVINQIEIINRQTKQYQLLKYSSNNSLCLLQTVSDFSSSCFFSAKTNQNYISCFGGFDSQRKQVTQVGLIEVNLTNFTYSIKEILNKQDFHKEYLEFYRKNKQVTGKKSHSNLQNYNQEKNQQILADKNVKDFWKKVPFFFTSSQSVYDEVSDSIYVFGGNANKKENLPKESIITSSLSCSSFCWEEYLCIAKFQNVSSTVSLKDVIFLKLEVKNMNEIIYQNTIFLNEQKIQKFEPLYGTQNSLAQKIEDFKAKKAEFSTLFRHSNILSYRIPAEQNKDTQTTQSSMEIEQKQPPTSANTADTFVIQQSHPTHFRQQKLTQQENKQPHQLISMAFSLDTDPLPKIQLQVKVGCC